MKKKKKVNNNYHLICRFTLANMFTMDLAKFQDIAEAIVTNAVKELAIERGVKEIADVWKTMEFTVIKHYKSTNNKYN